MLTQNCHQMVSLGLNEVSNFFDCNSNVKEILFSSRYKSDHYKSLHRPQQHSCHRIDLLHKSHYASVPYPTLHHFVAEMRICVHGAIWIQRPTPHILPSWMSYGVFMVSALQKDNFKIAESCLNIKTVFPGMEIPISEKRRSWEHGNSYTGKMASLYWDAPLRYTVSPLNAPLRYTVSFLNVPLRYTYHLSMPPWGIPYHLTLKAMLSSVKQSKTVA